MDNGFTVLLIVLGIGVSARAYAQPVAPGPGVVEVTIIPGRGTLFTNGQGHGGWTKRPVTKDAKSSRHRAERRLRSRTGGI
jgi:hypothetical protein